MFVYFHPCNFYVGQGIACLIKCGNVMQCEHALPLQETIQRQKAFQTISFVPHPAQIIHVHPKYAVGDAYPT
jgi:hypothetical protein